MSNACKKVLLRKQMGSRLNTFKKVGALGGLDNRHSAELSAELENIGISGSDDRMQELFRIIQKQPISFETLARFFILFKLDREEDTRAKQQGFIKKKAASVMKVGSKNMINLIEFVFYNGL